MKSNIKSITREPLLHFLLIGAVLFLVFDLTRDVVSEAPNRIVVTKGQQEQLAANFNRTWLRSPTKAELAGLVENYVREEVFYREAMAMGLDQDDPMVRQRMRMKLEFMLDDLSTQQVTDAALAEFLQKHPEKFRSEALEADAKELLTRLNSGTAADSVGDPTLSPYEYNLVTQSEIVRSLGERFANGAIKVSSNDWTGPIYSAYGAHLIKINERVEAHHPALEDIRERVKREYLVQLRTQQKDLVYNRLLDNYEVTLEPIGSTPSVASAQTLSSEIIATVQASESQ